MRILPGPRAVALNRGRVSWAWRTTVRETAINSNPAILCMGAKLQIPGLKVQASGWKGSVSLQSAAMYDQEPGVGRKNVADQTIPDGVEEFSCIDDIGRYPGLIIEVVHKIQQGLGMAGITAEVVTGKEAGSHGLFGCEPFLMVDGADAVDAF